MPQQQSPWLETAYGWAYGEDGWNTGMDSNLLKFSVMFDRNVDSIASTLPPAVNGQVHYSTTDNRLYFAVNTTYFSTPVPKWFTIVDRSTGATWQFNGSSLVALESVGSLDARLDAVELTLSSLGSAAFEDVSAFATQAALDVVEAQTQSYTDQLRQELLDDGSELVRVKSALAGAVERSLGTRADDWVSVKDFGAVADGDATTGAGTDNWAAFQAAIDTGRHVHVPGPGVYRIHEKELQFLTAGQVMSGDGMGSSYGPQSLRNHVHHTTLMFTGTGERYVKTRRAPRETVGDPDDAPLATAINVQNEGVSIRDMAVFCHCNYAADETVANLGADWDVGIFNGSYALMDLQRVRVMGYWRVAGVYVDVTHTATLPRFTNPRTGQPFPQGTYSGADKISLNQVWASGGRKGLWVAGAVNTLSGNYYDGVSETTYGSQGNRGNAGCSEFVAVDCFFWGRDHHSGWRAYDPRGDMNFDLEDLDAISAPVVIDGRRGGASQERLRRFMLTRCRTNTRECVRGIAFGRAYEVYIDDLNTETTSGNSFDTAGNPIAPESAAVNYGPLAVVTPSGVAVGSDSIYVDGINSVPNATHFQNKLTLWSLTGVGSGSTAGRANYNDVRVAGGSWNNNGLSVFASSAQRMLISDSANVMYQLVRPNVDNSINLGSGTFRWGTIFSATGTINTSDEREKEQQRELYAAERAAAMELKAAMRAFKWKEAVDRKGDSARWHFGVMAQGIQRIFERHGLDAHEYGMFCYDEWDELPQLTHHHPAEIDENGNVVSDAWDEVVQEHRPAGNRYGVRYDQLLAFIIAAI